MELVVTGKALHFSRVDLVFFEHGLSDVFAGMNTQTVGGTISKKRYLRLASEVVKRYPGMLTNGVGDFLYRLKRNGDPFYRRFLNSYGDLTYCRFAIKDHLSLHGIYAYRQGERLVYIGRCLDTFRKRINLGYGAVHPRNCYLDGQATNCHLNALIAGAPETVSLFVAPMADGAEIKELERRAILQYRPLWNIALSMYRPGRGSEAIAFGKDAAEPAIAGTLVSGESSAGTAPVPIVGSSRTGVATGHDSRSGSVEGGQVPNIQDVWQRIEQHVREPFHQIRGAEFRYQVTGGQVLPDRTNVQIARSAFEEALNFVPLANTTPVQHLRGPSYIYAILMDQRISAGDW